MDLLPTLCLESLHSQAARHSRALPSCQGLSHVVREQRRYVRKLGRYYFKPINSILIGVAVHV